jgi:enoyl-CoA hydratase
MTDQEQIVVQRTEDSVTITLSRPKALNAITLEMLLQIEETLEAVGKDNSVRTVVLTGAGRSFSAGVDLKALNELRVTHGSVGDLLNNPARSVIRRLTTIPKVVIAKVNGHCFTGALELALACDLIVTANEAVFGDTHAKWGLRPTWGMSQRLQRVVGIARARELSYTARTFTGVEAAALGLAVRSVPLADLDATVADMAAEIAANSPGAIAAYKDLYRAALECALPEGLAYEAEVTYEIADSAERLARFR